MSAGLQSSEGMSGAGVSTPNVAPLQGRLGGGDGSHHWAQVWGASFPATGWTQCSEDIFYFGEDQT